MSRIAVRINGLSKQYRIGQRERYKALRDTLTEALSAPLRGVRALLKAGPPGIKADETFWALKDVSFEVPHGQVVGIIGRNGAGKSTLLKILSRITQPTEGRAEIHGRVGSLLEVGTGFHPELTGRENVYLNGAILGMRKAEIARKFDEIVAFAEIDKFIDTPVKRYSSGMYVRLAFAVAAHLEPEILLVDEVLAVGDLEFQRKCLGKMQTVATQGRTVFFVSHNLQAIERLCQRGIVLKSGRLVYDGTASQACEVYLKGLQSHTSLTLDANIPRQGDGRIKIARLEVVEATSGLPVTRLLSGADFTIRFHFQAREPVMFPRFGFALLTAFGTRVFNTSTMDSPVNFERATGTGVAELQVTGISLAVGSYVCNLSVTDRAGSYCDYIRDVPCFEIEPSDRLPQSRLYDQSSGVIYPQLSWALRSDSLAAGQRLGE